MALHVDDPTLKTRETTPLTGTQPKVSGGSARPFGTASPSASEVSAPRSAHKTSRLRRPNTEAGRSSPSRLRLPAGVPCLGPQVTVNVCASVTISTVVNLPRSGELRSCEPLPCKHRGGATLASFGVGGACGGVGGRLLQAWWPSLGEVGLASARRLGGCDFGGAVPIGGMVPPACCRSPSGFASQPRGGGGAASLAA